MDRGGSLRRRLSSLRGAWRWSTGYLFRKVGRHAGDGRDPVASNFSCVFCLLLWNCFSRLLHGLLPAPNVSLPPSLPPSLRPSLALSQMVNLNGLLVKSTSTDGFHLETGPLDPPLQFPPPPPPPPPPPHPLPRLPPFFPAQVLKREKTGLRCRWSDVQELRRLISRQ